KKGDSVHTTCARDPGVNAASKLAYRCFRLAARLISSKSVRPSSSPIARHTPKYPARHKGR
ncbi:MAG: hypothetical protein Q8N45_01325, partial [Anaerolineales bacterium]|nr:hypothetical protein [Anaerolineales bacterium]